MKKVLYLLLFAASLSAVSQSLISGKEVFRIFRQKPHYVPAARLVRADSATLSRYELSVVNKANRKNAESSDESFDNFSDTYIASRHYLMVYKNDTVLVDNSILMGEDAGGNIYYKSRKFSFGGIVWRNKPSGNNFLNRLYIYYPACCVMRFDELCMYTYSEADDSLQCLEKHYVPAHDWTFARLPLDSIKPEGIVFRQTELKHSIKKNDVFETVLKHQPYILPVQTKLTILSTVPGYYFVRQKRNSEANAIPSYYYGWVKQTDCKVIK
ncbi:MAG: hypothetical protein JST26_07385 [Bacteroidetes bacterium]|nr:hypothetical protein [Bacteroidota bacterium]